VMAWMMDTYSANMGGTVTGVVTGKPIELGGSLGRVRATGRGVFLTAREAARSLGMALEDIRVAVQGFGNVGGVAAELMAQAKARVVAVQDHTGSLYKADGLDIAALSRHAREHGGIAGFTGGDAISEEDFWGVDCDLLIPAALEGQLDGPRAER